MILKKPYAFFIKIFKPIHILMGVLISYLIYISNNILHFFNVYIHSNENVVGQEIKNELFSKFLYIIPVVIMIFSLIFLGIMFSKKKNVAFYIVNIFIYLVVLITNVYIYKFLGSMEEIIVSIKAVKLMHDLVLLNMFVEIMTFILLLIRGLGLNFKKFNFDSDISKLNISEFDKEEIELNINVDLDYIKRNRKRNFRHFKYLYKENKFIINIVSTVILIIILATSFFVGIRIYKKNVEGVVYFVNNFNLKVNKSIFLNKGFDNNQITENYLVIVDMSLKTNLNNFSLFVKDFSLEVGDAVFHSQNKYSNDLIDIGTIYNEQRLTSSYSDYLLVFEVPSKYIESDFVFVYSNNGEKTKINLDPQNYISSNTQKMGTITEKMDFSDSLGEINFIINKYEISDKFFVQYNYCVTKEDCILSKEYIKSSIDENFDKYILKLDVDYSDDSGLNFKNFYDFFSKFGKIEYKIGDVLYTQSSNFEEIKSKKVNEKKITYIGVDSNIALADSIKLIFNIRDAKYIYVLK